MDKGELEALIAQVHVLELRPTDALVITPSHPLSEEEAVGCAEQLRALFPETKIIITEHPISVLREEEGVPGD